MKFSWKIFISTLIIVLLALSLGGIFMVSTSFSRALELETNRIVKENQTMMSEIAALIKNYNKSIYRSEEDALKGVLALLSADWSRDGMQYRITGASGEELLVSKGMERIPEIETIGTNVLSYRIFRVGEKYYIQAKTVMQLSEQCIIIENCNDITAAYTARDSQKKLFLRIIVGVGGLCAILNAVFTIWLTRPIVTLTKATKRLAEGDMRNRVQIRSSDEIGTLADGFNIMARTLEDNILHLQEAARKQEDFVGSFAHEIKTPLTSIIGYADLLRSGMLEEEATKEAAQYIFAEGKRLESLSVKLLELLVDGKKELVYSELMLRSLVEEVLELMSPRLIEKGIKITCELPDISVRIDKDLMKSVLINVIDNARKAVNINGRIWIQGCRKGDRTELSISDNGYGIPSEELERITESFYMVDKSRSRQESGAGLGLTLCTRIMELHQGTITFESELTKGTKVILSWKGAEQ